MPSLNPGERYPLESGERRAAIRCLAYISRHGEAYQIVKIEGRISRCFGAGLYPSEPRPSSRLAAFGRFALRTQPTRPKWPVQPAGLETVPGSKTVAIGLHHIRHRALIVA